MARLDRLRRELRGSAIALLMVAVTTLIVYALTLSLEIRRGSAVYLLPVLLAGWHLGLVPALVAAVAVDTVPVVAGLVIDLDMAVATGARDAFQDEEVVVFRSVRCRSLDAELLGHFLEFAA